jgi:spore maturation protein CgeB
MRVALVNPPWHFDGSIYFGLAILNISRNNMAATGFSPATRVFEAAGVGACVITDAWEGIEQFLAPGKEVLVVRDGADVAVAVRALTPEAAANIDAAARARMLSEHMYQHRAAVLDRLLTEAVRMKRAGKAA